MADIQQRNRQYPWPRWGPQPGVQAFGAVNPDPASCDIGACARGSTGATPAPGAPVETSLNCTGCLDGSEPVLLAGGGCKPAAEVEVGDLLLSGDGGTDTVVALIRREEPRLRFVHAKGEFVCSRSHKLLTSEGEVLPASEFLDQERSLLGYEGEPVKILSLFELAEGPVFGWTCEPSHTFRCAGVQHHNKTLPPFSAADL